MKKRDSLAAYREKRDLKKTPESSGKRAHPASKQPIFVIQKHDASRLHYDFRIEFGGVLKSWAIPKGPSTNPKDKRLAMPTEDHPMEYGKFEGIIPEGEYGAGAAIVWDSGRYRNLSETNGREIPIDQALRQGRVKIWLDGEKLKGGYALTRIRPKPASWLLVKINDSEADARRDITKTAPQSVLTGKTVEELRKKAAQHRGRVEMSERRFGSRRETQGRQRAGSRNVKLSRPDKLLFPDDGIRKQDIIDYYERISEVILPHIKDRPLMLQRFPNGIGEKSFFQKNVSYYFPNWIKRTSVKKAGGKVTHVLCNDVSTLVYLANLACITPHIWLSRVPELKHPDLLVFDLDPAGEDFGPVRRTAFALRELLDEVGLKGFPMTTGSRGLHVSIPLNREMDFDRVRAFARTVAELLAQRDPRQVTVAARKDQRRGRVYIDVMRNAYAQTAVAPYALRAKPGAPIATPLDWDELSDARLHSQRYNLRNIFQRIETVGDPWKSIWRHPQALDRAQQKLNMLGHTEERRVV
jgi:bifunctional non-homologous end joining protein LigD